MYKELELDLEQLNTHMLSSHNSMMFVDSFMQITSCTEHSIDIVDGLSKIITTNLMAFKLIRFIANLISVANFELLAFCLNHSAKSH